MVRYVLRRILYNVPVYLTILLFVMAALRVHDPIYAYLGKNATREQYENFARKVGLDRPFLVQYADFVYQVFTLDFRAESWERPGMTVGELLAESVGPSLAITVPAFVLTTVISVLLGVVAGYFRGRVGDRMLMFVSVIGMSISFLVYIILGQYWGAFLLAERFGWDVFAIWGYEPGLDNWAYYCLLPVLISVVVGIGYDTRYYRAVIVEESDRDYVTTALAKGVSRRRAMLVHVLANAMIPIITRIVISLPFLVMGSILLENFFGIPGMGRALITAVTNRDFPVVQAFTAVFAAIYIGSIILTDVLYAVVDPRVSLES